MEIKNLLASFVILLTYVGLTLGHLPFFRMNRAGIILVGVTILSLMGIINLKEAWQSIDAQTLVFLFGIMILNAHLGYAGFFGFSMQVLLRYARSPLALLCIISFSSGLLSAFFLNDTMALMLTPLVYGVVKALKLNPNPYLLALMFSVNTGSLMTPTGNPQNILIASISGLSFVTFIKNLWIVSLFGLLLQILILTFIYPEVRSLKPLPPLEMTFRVHKGLLRKGIMVTSGLFLAFLAGLPMAESAFIACGLLLFTRRLRSERYFSKIDWELLILFRPFYFNLYHSKVGVTQTTLGFYPEFLWPSLSYCSSFPAYLQCASSINSFALCNHFKGLVTSCWRKYPCRQSNPSCQCSQFDCGRTIRKGRTYFKFLGTFKNRSPFNPS